MRASERESKRIREREERRIESVCIVFVGCF
jgi:hypothetical protein